MKKFNPIFLILCFFVLTFFQCQNKEISSEENYYAFSKKYPSKDTIINLNILKFDNEKFSKINEFQLCYVDSIFQLEETFIFHKNYQEICENFVRIFEKTRTELPEYETVWKGELQSKLNYKSDKIWNFTITHWMFTGGAHGNGGLKSIFFDPTKNKILKQNEWLKNKTHFTEIAERFFRKKYQLNPTQNINDTGFWFKNDKFHLPENFLIHNEGITLYYNTYEIAPYVEGPKEVQIPFKEIESDLNFSTK